MFSFNFFKKRKEKEISKYKLIKIDKPIDLKDIKKAEDILLNKNNSTKLKSYYYGLSYKNNNLEFIEDIIKGIKYSKCS